MDEYYPFVCISIGEFNIKHVNEYKFVSLQINVFFIRFYISVNEGFIQTNANDILLTYFIILSFASVEGEYLN